MVPTLTFLAITAIAGTVKKSHKFNNQQDSETIRAEKSAGTFEYGELDEDIKREPQKMEALEKTNHKVKKEKKAPETYLE